MRSALRGRLFLIGVVAASLLGGYLIWHYHSPRPNRGNALGLANLAPGTKYVGDQTCAGCHRSIAHSYSRTAMARSWRRPTNTDAIEDYSATHEVMDEAAGYRYQVYREDGRVFQREYRVDEHGKVTQSQVREVAYVLGSGAKGRAYITDSEGYLTIMPVAWYTHAGRWDMNSGYGRTNLRFSREVIAQCIGCHNSYPEYVSGSGNRYQKVLPEGIGCERCHGPGELHIQRQTAASGSARNPGPDPTIVNPARLPVDLQQDVCLQCHLSTPVTFSRRGEPFDYRPGLSLADFRANFLPAGQEGETITAVSHGTRAALSRCFTESGRKMTCTYCHDPHVPTREVDRDFFNARCTSCHEPDACTRPRSGTGQAEAHRTNDCVACHMPQQEPRDIEHTVTTDHWIRRPASSSSPPAPSRRDKSVPLVDFFGASERGELGFAHVLFGGSTGRPENVNEGIVLLRESLNQRPDDVRLQCWLGFALHRQGRHVEAAGYLEQAWRRLGERKGDWPLSEQERISLQVELARALRQLGQHSRALAVVDNLLETAPDYIPAYELSAEINRVLGRLPAVTRAVQAGLKRNPANPRLWFMLGLQQLEAENDPAAALTSLKRALELDPLQHDAESLMAKVKTILP